MHLKVEFYTEPYIFRIKNQRNRYLLARAGCLNLESEIGRWQGIDRQNRICKLCSSGIENEVHFLSRCSRLEQIRKQFDCIFKFDDNILCDEDRFEFLCCENSHFEAMQVATPAL